MNEQPDSGADVSAGVDPGLEPGSEPEAPDEAAETERLRAELAAVKDEMLRMRAAADNLRKRAERDVEAAHKYAVERFANELLPVKDSMELGLSAALAATEVGTIKQGMEMTLKMLHDFLDKMRIRKLDPQGERFDPDFHQAMTMREADGIEPGTVLQVLQSGYLLNDRLLRPALVVVSRAPVAGDG